MTRTTVLLSVICLSLAACAETNRDALSMGSYSGSSGGRYPQGYTGTGTTGSGDGLLGYRTGDISAANIDRHGR